MKSAIAAVAVILAWLTVVIGVVYGYINNIVMLVTHTGEFGVTEVIRAIGIIAGPLGVVMGYVG